MSHSLLWRHIVLLTVGVYSSKHRVLYTIGISMTKRFQKSVGPSVCPFVTLTKRAYSSFIIVGGGWLYLYSFIYLSAGVVE